MKSLFLAWQEPAQRAWFPIGRLDAVAEHFTFRYTGGARNAQSAAGFQPLDAFPDLNKLYESAELFPLFQNRLISPKREDFAEHLKRMGLEPAAVDPMDILAISGGERETDNLEVFPKIEKRRDGSFVCRAFLHGWRHVNSDSRERLLRLQQGEELRVAIELNNPATAVAIQLQTTDEYYMVGWTPRYLVKDFLNAIATSPTALKARVIRVNPPPAPHNQRVLFELEGFYKADFEPMSSEEFQPLVM